MPIKVSLTQQISALLADLGVANNTVREAAIARLTVIGGRAVERLITLSESNASSTARVGALRALEAIGDPRALEPALRAVTDRDPNVAVAAIGVARRFLTGASGASAVDKLTALVLDRAPADDVRVAALRALRTLGAAALKPLLRSLADDPIVAASARPSAPRGAEMTLAELLAGVETARDRQRPAARAAAHLALAKRSSRIALYDLREWLDAAREPLPADALTALSIVGDGSCLEPIAKAWSRSRDQRLLEAFGAIVKRERLTRRHRVIRRIEERWPTFFHWRRGPTGTPTRLPCWGPRRGGAT
jgi:HEAT repeat protein